jgi:serine/threonine-protein kinase
MGAVYRALDTRLNRVVAVKVLLPHLASESRLRERFEREARAVAALSHPNICAVYDVGETPTANYLVMELLEGETLQQRIRSEGRLDPVEAGRVVLQLLAGLGAAHAADIVHRDLKPANVFLTHSHPGGIEFVKILDFGVSKFSPHENTEAPGHAHAPGSEDMGATAGRLLGTPFYMSPEQAKGARHVDHRSDLYAVGVILYECVTGKVPFDAATLNELIFRIVLEAPPPVETLVPDLDPAFTAIVNKAMAREPGERFQSAREMHEALSHWLAPSPIGIDTSSALLWASAPRRSRGKKSERAFVLGLLATLALGGATLFTMGDPKRVPQTPPALAASSTSADPAATVAAPPSASVTTAPQAAPSPARAEPASLRRPAPRATPVHKPASPVVVPAKRTVPDDL